MTAINTNAESGEIAHISDGILNICIPIFVIAGVRKHDDGAATFLQA